LSVTVLGLQWAAAALFFLLVSYRPLARACLLSLVKGLLSRVDTVPGNRPAYNIPRTVVRASTPSLRTRSIRTTALPTAAAEHSSDKKRCALSSY
jgi:hypothetical protein